jgi:ankyrin repeat protein
MNSDASDKMDVDPNLPLHWLLWNKESSTEDTLDIIAKYPAVLQLQDEDGNLPLHIECMNECRSSIIAKCIELYPEALAIADKQLDSSIWTSSVASTSMQLVQQYRGCIDDDGEISSRIEASER